MKSILLVKAGAVGDGLLLAPALHALRRVHPEARIEVLGFPWRLRLLVHPTLADRVSPLDSRATREFFEEFEAIVVFTQDPEAPLALRLQELRPGRVAVRELYPPEGIPTHVADHYQAALAHLGVEGSADREYRLPVSEDHLRAADRFLESFGAFSGPNVYVHPGTRISAKAWPAERFARLCRHLRDARGSRVLLGRGPLDEAIVLPILEHLGGASVVLAEGQNLEQTAGLLSRMDLMIGVDSGIAHLASLVGCPTLAIFGPARPEMWSPLGSRTRVLRGSRGLPCCATYHPRGCQADCTSQVTLEAVLEALDREPFQGAWHRR